ncbi:phage tail protein [Ralstonia solanacearum]|uniref:phage tail protein n=1 Tax=Ralstonia solanacearum TaxID=305 RepID=UPI001E3E98CB|nr:phage tail protein [Ralstonia solanacearum]
MPQTFFIVPTAAGDAKDANAKALGQARKYTHIAVGDGGGALPTPDRARTALVNERYRAQINSIWQDQTNPGQFVAELVIPESVGGWWIRELGLIDADGTLAYYGNCPETYKPQMAEGSGRTQSIRMVVLSATGAAVELKIDPAIVLATRQYVDDKVAAELNKLDGKQSVRVATTAAIAKTGLQTIDGVALAAGDRVLVKDQAAAPAENGIYVAAVGIWTRAADADQALEVTPGMLVPVEEGATNGDSLWQLATNGPITIGTTGLAFELVGGKTGVTAGTYRSVTVNTRGQVTGGTNPTTLAGYGITDALPRFTTGQALPTTNIGPIWHDDYNSLMTWQAFTANGANYTGYASVLVGNLLADTQPTPRAGYVRSGASNLSRTHTPRCVRGARHNGIRCCRHLGGRHDRHQGQRGRTTFAAYDVRGEFPRGWDDGRGADSGRGFGTWQSGSPVVHDDVGGTASFNIAALGDGSNVAWSSIADPWVGPFPLTMYDASAASFVDANNKGFINMSRPRNVAFLPCIKY